MAFSLKKLATPT